MLQGKSVFIRYDRPVLFAQNMVLYTRSNRLAQLVRSPARAELCVVVTGAAYSRNWLLVYQL